jgi:hypothetical protein
VRTVNWRTLPPAEAPAVWAALREWVGWLIHRYELNSAQIPDCWFMHGAIVEELSALYGYWQLSFQPDGSGGGPIAFHDRLLPTLKRFPDYGLTACAGTDHFLKSGRYFRNYTEETPTWEQTTHTYGPAGSTPAEFVPLMRSGVE